MADRTYRAVEAIRTSDVIVSYKTYARMIADLIDEQVVEESGMREEMNRCRSAIEHARQGKTVSVISSGDPGVYGMAGLLIELINETGADVDLEVVPGVSAANAAAARLGAPLMLDYAVISLSNLLVPWEQIERRVRAVAAADMVMVLYNPRSKRRIQPFEATVKILLEHREPITPVAVATAVGAEEETLTITTLRRLHSADINMRSTVIIGNSQTRVFAEHFVTRRGYLDKYEA